MKKKILTLLMAVALVVSFIPSLTFADGEGGGTKEISATVKQSVRDEGILGIFVRDYKTEITIKVSLPNDGNPDAKDYINIGGASQNGSDEFRISLVGQKNTEIESVTGVVKSSNRGEEKITLKWDSGTYYYHIPVEWISPEVTKLTVTMTHECEYNPAQIKAATCTEDGLETETCKYCKHQESRVIPALGHDYSEGYKYNKNQHWKECSRCKDDIDRASHSFSEWTVTKEPTSASTGAKSRKCNTCAYVETAVIPQLALGQIKVDKQFAGNPTDEEKAATYYVALYKDGKSQGTIEEISANEAAVFSNLSAGTYTLKEVDEDGGELDGEVNYIPEFSHKSVEITGKVDNECKDVTLTNTFVSKDTGDIKVKMVFAGNPTDEEKAATYYVALYKKGESQGTIKEIRANEGAVFSNLSAGTYTLKEVDEEGKELSGVNYTPSFEETTGKGDIANGNSITITIQNDKPHQNDSHDITLTNTFESKDTGDIKVKKVFAGNPTDEEKAATYYVALYKKGESQGTIKGIRANEGAVFSNLSAGTYTLKEVDKEGKDLSGVNYTPSFEETTGKGDIAKGNSITITIQNDKPHQNDSHDITLTNTFKAPVDPVDPPTPVDPKPPVTPVDPTTPTEPTTPDQPDTPDEPDEPDQPTKPDKPAKPGNTDNDPDPADDQKTNDPDQPQTGDESMLYLYLLLAVTASGAIVCIRKMNK